MTKSVYLMMMVVAAMLNAQELLPELAGPAAKHKAADEALDKQKQEAVAGATKSYLSVLDGIEKSATAKGELEVVAAVVKEREAAIAGTLDPDLPTALPKAKLQSSRKALLTKIEQLNADSAKRKKLADADYLRFLATLQTKAASNPELAKQLAAEKAALLAGGASAGAVAKVPRGKNMIVNGNFEKIVDGKPDGWGWENVDCVTVQTENGNHFVRFESNVVHNDGSIDIYWLGQKISFPNEAKTMSVSVRLRTKNCVTHPKTRPQQPIIQFKFLDKIGAFVEYVVVACWDEKNGSWKTTQSEKAVPKGAVAAVVQITNGHCPGQIDFDDIEVTFK